MGRRGPSCACINYAPPPPAASILGERREESFNSPKQPLTGRPEGLVSVLIAAGWVHSQQLWWGSLLMSSPMGLLLAWLPSAEEEGGEARLGGQGSGHGALGLWPLQAPFSELLYLWLQTPRAWHMRPTTCSSPLPALCSPASPPGGPLPWHPFPAAACMSQGTALV